MSTAPIINISASAGNAAAGKINNAGNSSGESFGDVLNREVNNGNANGNGSNGGSANGVSNSSNQSGASGSSAASSSTSTSSASGSTSGTSSSTSTGVNGKTGKSSSSSTSSSTSTSDPSASSSAQILALVGNVQQSVSGTPSSTVSTASSSKAIGSVSATSASTAASAITGTVIASTAGADKASTGNDTGTATTFEAAMKDAKLATNAAQSQQASTDDGDPQEQSPDTQSQTVLQNAAAPATPLILPAAAADKSIQASVAQMDNAALKVQQTVQAPQPSAVAATQQLAASEQLQSNSNDTLAPQVGSPSWDQALGQKVVWMAGGGQQSASLTLNPPDLGPMQVVLSVNNSHATVSFTSAQPEVRQALENAMPKLREMLGDAGIQLGQASINSGSAQQQNTASQQSSGNSSSRTSDDTVGAIETTAASVIRTSPLSAGLGLVDTFA